MADRILAAQVIEYLNGLLRVDREAIAELVDSRVPCNRKLADHPTVQVGLADEMPGCFEVGILGVLNGMCGVKHDGYGLLRAEYEDGNLVRFSINESDGGS